MKKAKKELKIATVKDETATTNPYGVNQFLIDPRQLAFLKLYIDPNSETFGNGYKSALTVGYSEHYAKELTSQLPKWLERKLEELDDNVIINQAEKNIKEVLEISPLNTFTNKQGETITKLDTDLLRIKDNTSKWALERLNKDKYSSRTEHISKNLTIIQNIEKNIKNIAGNKTNEEPITAEISQEQGHAPQIGHTSK